MKKSISTEIINTFLDISNKIDESIRLVMDNDSQEEFNKYRRTAGKIMGDIFLDVISPIYKEHPDLTPPELRQ